MVRSWIPNGLSLGNLVFGFFSMIVAAHQSEQFRQEQIFLIAGILIMIAAIFDGLDGPMARKLDVQSPLGQQLDSLADLTTFGLAPGYLIYQMYLSDLRIFVSWLDIPYGIPLGMLIAAIYPVSAAFRLARFNVNHEPGSFTGLPSPVAGVFIAFIPLSFHQEIPLPRWAALTLYIIMAFLMVSNVKYGKPQSTLFSRAGFFRIAVFTVLITALIIWLGWYWVLFSVITLYIFSGLVALVFHLLQRLKLRFSH